jgi:glycosyltransferase involved in cell wall biosynthesis
MTFGIVISSYKYGHLAAHCIESILAQTVQYDKIWFVDDGVGDCQHIKKLYGDRLIFIQNPHNRGIVDNFNQMLNLVDTDYIMFIGADNWLRSDSLEYIKSLFIQNDFNLDILTYDIVVTGELRKEIYKLYAPTMEMKNGDYVWYRINSHHGSMMYKVSLAKDVGGYAASKDSSRTDEDQNLWDKMNKVGAIVKYLNQALLYYRRHKENFNKY